MRKSERLGFVLSRREKSALRYLAEMEGGLSQSALLRRLIRAEAQRRGLWPEEQRLGRETPHADEEITQRAPSSEKVRSLA